MFCPKCGAQHEDAARFCPKCGQALPSVAKARRHLAGRSGAWVVMVASGLLVTVGLAVLIWYLWPRLELPHLVKTPEATSTALASQVGVNLGDATSTLGATPFEPATSSPTATPAPSATPSPQPSSTPTSTASPSPTATETPTLTPTLTPSATPTPRPTHTPVPSCAYEPTGIFAGLWRAHRTQLGCPLGRSPATVNDAEETFQYGHMFWRSDKDEAYVVYESGARKGSYQVFAGAWSEGQPEYSCTASPPAGLIQPKRGFGAVWCKLGAANSPTGWALGQEVGFGPGNGDPLVQDFEHGTIFRDSDGLTRKMAYMFVDDGTFMRAGY